MSGISSQDARKPFILIGAIVAALLIQSFYGEPIASLFIVTKIGVFLVITLIMLGIDFHKFVNAFTAKVKETSIAIGMNFVFIPLLAWAMGWAMLKNYPDLWIGFLLYTLTPCIGWYLIFTDLAKGNTAWGVTLLPWNIVLQLVLLPVYLFIFVGLVLPIEYSLLFEAIALYLVGPLLASIAVRKVVVSLKGAGFFQASVLSRTGGWKMFLLVIVIMSLFLSQPSLGTEEAFSILLLIALLVSFFVIVFAAAILAGYMFGFDYEDTVALVFTTTARNSEAVIGIAIAAFPGYPLVYLAIIIGPMVELPVLLVLSRILLGIRGTLKARWLGQTKVQAGQ